MKSYEIEPGVNAQTILRTGDLEVSGLAVGVSPVEIDLGQTGNSELQQRRPLYIIAFALALLSLLFREPVLLLAGLLIFALAFVPEVWYRWGLRALAIDRRPATNRAEFGDTVEVVLTLENRKPLPLPWLEISDESAEALPARGTSVHPTSAEGRVLLRQTVAIWAYQRLRRRYSVHATARGVYPFGPLTVRLTDPFGILERDAQVRNFDYLLVHPLVAPLERFGLPPNAPFGERKSPIRLLEDPLRIAGVRDYERGDEPRRIHWKATARTGTLQSKVYEPATRHSLIILLDVRTLSNPLMGYDPNLVELAITAAASVATWASEQRYALGIHSNGTQTLADAEDAPATDSKSSQEYVQRFTRATPNLRLCIPISNDSGQLTRVLDGLARVLPYYGLPMDQLIAAELPHLPFGATVVYIGAESVRDVPLIVALRQLKLRGHAVTLLLTTSRSDEASQTDVTRQLAGLPTHAIGDRTLWDGLVADVLGPDAIRRNVAARSLRVPLSSRAAQGPNTDNAHYHPSRPSLTLDPMDQPMQQPIVSTTPPQTRDPAGHAPWWSSSRARALFLAASAIGLELLPVEAVLVVVAAGDGVIISGVALPFWYGVLLLAVARLIGVRLRRVRTVGAVALSVPLVLIAWLTLLRVSPAAYGQGTRGPLDLQWLSALVSDIVSGTDMAAHALGLLLLVVYLWSRGVRLGTRPPLLDDILRRLKVGMVVLVAAIAVLTVTQTPIRYPALGAFTLFLPAEVFCGLVASALARLAAQSLTEAEAERQLQWVSSAIGLAGGVVALALLLGLIFSGGNVGALLAHLGPVGVALDALGRWITDAIGQLLGFIFGAPIRALKSVGSHLSTAPITTPSTCTTKACEQPDNSPPPLLLIILAALFYAFLLLVLVLLIVRLYRVLRAWLGKPSHPRAG